MYTSRSAPFGELLRRHRVAIGLTQEALAERAGLSANGIQKLERGARRPQRETARRLTAALGLAGEDARAFAGATSAPRLRRPPPGETAERTQHNLPLAPTSLVGRQQELAALTALLDQEDTRLVTLTGPGGVGKTRLALQVAAELRETFSGGVWWVELAALADPALVMPAVARALGVSEEADPPLPERLAAALRDRRLLLALDNCEHLLDAAAALAGLLAACPRLALLATSRAPLRLRAEQAFPVPPLGLPSLDGRLALDEIEQAGAVRLFTERARAVRPDFALTAGNAVAVAAICRRLDGLPLAIELAAACVRTVGPPAILERLEHRLPLPGEGPRDVPARQQTLRATIDWSYGLLAPARQALFRLLGIFPDGWELEAAACLTARSAGTPPDLLSEMAELTAHSLVQPQERADGAVAFRMLETIRDYGLEQLAASGEAATTEDAFLRHYVAVADQARAAMGQAGQQRWLIRLEADYASFRHALELAMRSNDAMRALRLANTLGHFWCDRGGRAEGQRWLERAIALEDGPPDERAAALVRLAGLAFLADDLRAAHFAEEAEALARSAGDQAIAAQALLARGRAAHKHGLADDATIEVWYAEALALARASGDRRTEADALFWQARLILEQGGDPARADAILTETIAIRRELGDDSGLVGTLVLAGTAARRRGDAGGAQRRHAQALALARRLGSRQGEVYASIVYAIEAYDAADYAEACLWFARCIELNQEMGKEGSPNGYRMLAAAEAADGAFDKVRGLFAESLRQWQAIGHEAGVRWVLDGLAALAAMQRQPARALRLAGAADAAPRPPAWRANARERVALDGARQALGEEAAVAAWAAGRALSLEEAVAEALAGAAEV